MNHLEAHRILIAYHNAPYGGHFGGTKTDAKVLQSGFWPSLFKYVNALVNVCDRSQRVRNISMRQEMPLTNILEIELFDV